MKRIVTTILLFTTLHLMAAQAFADQVFVNLWEAASRNSPEQRAARLTQEAAEIARDRAGRHWVPQVHAEAKAFTTDDPTVTFINLLGERQVTGQDFNPAQLNTPGSHTFTQSGATLELPLYEGGAPSAGAKAQAQVARARSVQTKATELRQYAEVVRRYGTLMALQHQLRTMNTLAERVNGSLKRYHLGNKSNPVGYSGLLALRALKNRIAIAINSITVQSDNERQALEAIAARPVNDTTNDDVASFLKVYAPAPSQQQTPTQPAPPPTSLGVQSARLLAESADFKVSAERAKYLPQVGVFGQENLYTGDRGASSGYVAGAYLRWNLSPSDLGSATESRLQAAAAHAEAESAALNDRVAAEGSLNAIPSSEKSLLLLKESESLLDEQWTVSEKLFRSGTLTAHQLADALSKQADVAEARTATENNLIKSKADLLTRSELDVSPEAVRSFK